MENYEETIEYTKDGKPDNFECEGIITYIDENDIATLLSIDFVYKDNGNKPAYCLSLDNCHSYVSTFMKYK